MHFFKVISSVVAIAFITTSCTELTSTATSSSKCSDGKCLPPQEEPPPAPQPADEMSIAAEECLWCLGSASEACLDENQDCLSSLACKSWRDCTESCISNNFDENCYNSCDAAADSFFTPSKVKTCNCEICYSQCLNMCPQD